MSGAIIICIGDELLIGQTVDNNSVWIGKELNKIGISILKKYAIEDSLHAIQSTVHTARQEADLVIICGGLGPTKDDVTKKALNEYFGGTMIRNEIVYQHVKAFFEKRNRPFLPVNELQAEVPDNCEVLFNSVGTAPGMLFAKDEKWTISLPGVPNEVITIMTEEALPRIAARWHNPKTIIHKTMLIFGRGESFVAKDIEDIEDALPPYLHLAYLPHYSELRLRLSGESDSATVLKSNIDIYFALIAERLEKNLVALDDISMQQAVVEYFIKNRLTVSTAESCTGGLVGSLITEVVGSSAAYLGSIVAYQNHVKTYLIGVKEDTIADVGAVSEETVIEMAEKTRKNLDSDYCVALSGILGPDGGTEFKPVGTVWLAVAGPSKTFTQKIMLPWKRLINKEMAAKWALYYLLREAQIDLARH